MATPQLLLSAFARAFALSETLPENASEYAEALQEIRELQEQEGWVVIRVLGDGISAGGEAVSDLYGDVGKLRGALDAAGVREVRLQEEVDQDTLEDFFQKLRPSSAQEDELPSRRFRGLEDVIGLSFRTAVHPLPGMTGGIQRLFQDRELPAMDDWEGAELRRALEGGAGDIVNGEPEPAPPGEELEVAGSDGLPSELSQELRTYLQSYHVLKDESGNRLRTAAAELKEGRDYRTLVKLVGSLVEAGTRLADDEAVALAEELTTPTVASCLVAQIAASTDEEEREWGTWVLSRIGPEGVEGLRNALEESRERAERRNLLDAMVTLGPPAYEMAREMVRDSRWYVVRNGVTILGEFGGEGTLALLTRPLANEDPRVRRETVMALTKIGGAEAERLVLGMLEDGAPQVRRAVCRMLGATGSPQAAKSLLPLLGDKDQGTQVECLQALGNIGDAPAVRPIVKKAMGGFFSRPPREVRIGAFRALAGIGTPEALRALQKGTKDGDKEVRAVCKALTGRD